MATRAAAAAAAIAFGPQVRIAVALLDIDVDPVGTAAELCCAVDGETVVAVVVPLTSAASSSGFCAKNCRV